MIKSKLYSISRFPSFKKMVGESGPNLFGVNLVTLNLAAIAKFTGYGYFLVKF